MCEVCNGFATLIESTKISNMVWWCVGDALRRDDLDEEDNSLVLEVRNGRGYLRLGDREDMGCLDHSDKYEIKYCPECGRKFGE